MIDTSLMGSLPKLMGFGGALAVIGGSAFAWIKGVPQQLWGLILNQLTVHLTVRDTDPIFPSLIIFFNKPEYMQKCKRLLAQCVATDPYSGYYTSSLDADKMKKGVMFTRAPGKHILWYRRKLIVFTRLVDDKKTGVGRPVESLTLRTWGKSDEILRSLIEEARLEIEKTSSSYLDVRVSSPDGWAHIMGSRKRALDTVVLRDELSNFIVKDLSSFLSKSDFYYSTGTPYHRGYLLEGPPGGGKSSLVQALATHFDFPLYVLNLQGVRGDDQLRTLFRSISKKSFLLIEDIDTVFISESRKNKEEISGENESRGGVTLGGFLNVLDGVFAADGLVVFMTTNHPEKLDSALIRPGRIDERIRIDYASPEQAAILFRKFYQTFDGSEDFVNQTKDKNISMAELQEQLISKTLSGKGKLSERP